MTPEIFAPGVISKSEYEMNSVFSPEGDEFFCVISTTTPEEKKYGPGPAGLYRPEVAIGYASHAG